MAALLFLTLCAYVGAFLWRVLPAAAVTGGAAEAAAPAWPLRGIAVRRELLLDAAPEAAEDGERLSTRRSGAGAGLWFSGIDGFEDLTPEDLEALDIPGLEALLERSAAPEPGATGRLVLDAAWYYAALSSAEGSAPSIGSCMLLFEGLDRPLPAKLLRVEQSGGQRLLLFRLTEGGQALCLRKTDAQLLGSA